MRLLAPVHAATALRSSSGRRNCPVYDSAHLRDLLGRADRDDLAARLAALGAEVDEPVGLLDHVEVVLDHEHVLPPSTSRCSTSSSFSMSAKCRPVVGSSRM